MYLCYICWAYVDIIKYLDAAFPLIIGVNSRETPHTRE